MCPRSLIARPANHLAGITVVAVGALSLLLFALPRDTAAQGTSADSSLTPGTRVRIVLAREVRREAPGETRRETRQDAAREARREVAHVGTLIGATERSLVLRPDRSRDTIEIARDSIARAQVSMGRSRNGRTAKGLLIGAVFGAGFGLAVGEDCSENDFICFDRGETVPLSIPGFGTFGALLGAITWRERWKDAPNIFLAPSSTGGFAMGAEVRF